MTIGYALAAAEVNLPDGPPIPSWEVNRIALVEVTQRADLGWYEWQSFGEVCLR
jgi:hypothetical protein